MHGRYPPGAGPIVGNVEVKMARLILEGKLPVPCQILIRHDLWCFAHSGGLCICDPFIELTQDAAGEAGPARLE